jgi:hypothetical protein
MTPSFFYTFLSSTAGSTASEINHTWCFNDAKQLGVVVPNLGDSCSGAVGWRLISLRRRVCQASTIKLSAGGANNQFTADR